MGADAWPGPYWAVLRCKPLTNGSGSGNGVFVVRSDFSIDRVVHEGPRGKKTSRWMTAEERIAEFKEVLRHSYWEEDSMVESVRELNDAVFLNKFTGTEKTESYAFSMAELPVEKEFDLACEKALIEREKIAAECAEPDDAAPMRTMAL